MLTYPNRTTCERRLEGSSGFSVSPVRGWGALSEVVIEGASPGIVMDDDKPWAPEDGGRVRQCLYKIDIVVKGF